MRPLVLAVTLTSVLAAGCSSPVDPDGEPSPSPTGPDRTEACTMIRKARLESLDETVSALLTVQNPAATVNAVRAAGRDLVETLRTFAEELAEAAEETDDGALSSAARRWSDEIDDVRADVARAGADPARIQTALDASTGAETEIFDLCREVWPS